ncbi:uncharacterized protein [Dermacentor albipictus]|uniref:uncharacterized protein n=1 Tax=Dermacentor albipictus TaxID=60249 RepID=UPI0031FCA80F
MGRMTSSTKAQLHFLLCQLLHSRDCSPRKEFLRLCWIAQDDTEALSRRECEHLQRQCGYIEWLINVDGMTQLNEPRVSTPESCSEDQEDRVSTCPPPSVETSVLAFDASTKTDTSLPFNVYLVLSLSPMPWKSGRTPSPVHAPRRCRGPLKLVSEIARSTSRHWNPSPMLWYYIWDQQQQRSKGTGAALRPRRVQQWLQDRVNRCDLASVIAGVQIVR